MADQGLESVATAKYFAFEIDGQPAERIKSVDPGAVEFEITDGTLGFRVSNEKEYTADKVTYRPWRAERFYDKGDT